MRRLSALRRQGSGLCWGRSENQIGATRPRGRWVRSVRNAPTADAAAHRAACPECAALARIWEATRPIEPSAPAWDDVWAGVTSRLDAQPQDVIPFATAARSPFRLRLIRLAQAAAVLAAVGLGWTQFGGPTAQDPVTPKVVETKPPAPPVRAETVDIATGEIVMLRDDGDGLHPVVLASEDRPGVDPIFQMFNELEAMAE